MILDTNAYTALVLKKPEIVGVLSGADRIGLPLPVVAELKQGFLRGTRKVENEKTLEDFMAQTHVEVLVADLPTTDQYASLSNHAKLKGRVLSNNDIWIAALTLQYGDTLVTYDRDFIIFQELMGQQLVVLK